MHRRSLGDRKTDSLVDAASGRSPNQRCLGSTHRPRSHSRGTQNPWCHTAHVTGLLGANILTSVIFPARPSFTVSGAWLTHSNCSKNIHRPAYFSLCILLSTEPTSLCLNSRRSDRKGAENCRNDVCTGTRCPQGAVSKAGTLSSPSLQGLTQCRAHKRHCVRAASVKGKGELQPEKSRDLNNVREINLLNIVNYSL